jgi:hypothetical protein
VEDEDVCESVRPLPEVTAGILAEAGVFAEAAPLMTGADSEFLSTSAARAGAALDWDTAAVPAAGGGVLAADGAVLDGGGADAAVAGAELAGAGSEAAELIIVGPKAAPCAACAVSFVVTVEPALELPALEVPALEVFALDVPATGEEPAAAPATGVVVSSEQPSPASSKVEGRTGAPLAGGRSGGSEDVPAGAATRATAAGGAPLPNGGNAPPLDLPLAGLAESSLRLGLAEARSSARAKSRARPALWEGSAALAAL